jgi:heme-degrading monooxygenase HmoA
VLHRESLLNIKEETDSLRPSRHDGLLCAATSIGYSDTGVEGAIPMYTVIERRKVNPDAAQQTMQRAQGEFFPRVQQAPGFVGLYLVPDETSGITTAVLVFASKEQFKAMEEEYGSAWQRALDEMGNALVSEDRGETVVSLEPKK